MAVCLKERGNEKQEGWEKVGGIIDWGCGVKVPQDSVDTFKISLYVTKLDQGKKFPEKKNGIPFPLQERLLPGPRCFQILHSFQV